MIFKADDASCGLPPDSNSSNEIALFKHELFDIYAFKDVPLDRDIYLMSEKWMVEYERSMLTLFKGGEYEAVGYIAYAAARSISDESIELSWYPTLMIAFTK